MGHRLLQSFLEASCPDANVPVDFGKLIAAAKATSDGAAGGDAVSGLKILIDAECCLDRLYGGMHADWLAGGDWNNMVEFLTSLRDACQESGVTLVVFLNGALEVPHMAEWAKTQTVARAHVKTALKQCFRPRRVAGRLWVAPAGLRTALRLALRHLGIEMACSTEEHRLEAMALTRERRLDGVMARHGSYVVFDPPRYFSAKLLKLTFKKEFLTTEFVIDKMAQSLDLIQDRFFVLGALLGNHILTVEDLKAFHAKAIEAKGATGSDTPAAASSSSGDEAGASEAAAKSKMTVEAVADFVRRLPAVDDLDALAALIFDASDAELFKHLTDKLKASIAYFAKGAEKGNASPRKSVVNTTKPTVEEEASTATPLYSPFASDSEEEKRQLLTETLSPSTSVSQLMLLRHQRGLLSPLILQILTHRHVKFETIVEDAADADVPTAIDLYQDLRRRIYGILLDAKSKKNAEDLVVNEWFATEENPTAERPRPVALDPTDKFVVEVPSLESLWFGAEPEDGQRRLRAFLTCMKANDDKVLLDKEKIPRQYLILCLVLRYVMEQGKESGKPVLSKAELEAFLATAVCPMMKNVRVTKEMQLRRISKRGLALGALFMQGVDFATLANDACGAPVPWQLTRPWEFFDGKIFHLKYLKATSGSSLLQVCDNKAEHVAEVERMRDAILSDRAFEFAELKSADATETSPGAIADPIAATGAVPKKKKGKKAGQPAEPSPDSVISPNSLGTGSGGSREAEMYATAYAKAYVAYCSSNNAPMPKMPGQAPASLKQMEADAYAKGYASAMASQGGMGGSPAHFGGGYQRPILSRGNMRRPGFVQRPPSSFRGRGNIQARIVREAAAYCNYHFGMAATPTPVGGRVGAGRVKRGGRGSGKAPFGGPIGADWNAIMGF